MSQAKFVYVTYIATTPEAVWDAITKPELAREYWGGKQNVSDWKVGSRWEHQNVADGNKVMMLGEVVESRPPHHMVWTWAAPGSEADPAQVSRVTFDIEQVNAMVRLTVVHDELEEGSNMHKGISGGWPRVLSSMKSFLETGKPLDISTPKAAATAAGKA